MNFPAALSLAGIDAFLTDEQNREVRNALLREEQMIASLDAEIAEAYAALEKLKRQRNKTQNFLHLNAAPSESELADIRTAITQREMRLAELEEEIGQVKLGVDALVGQQSDADQLSSDNSDAITVQSSLAQVDTEIQIHKAHLNHLMRERDEVLSDLDAQRAMLSPLSRLPLEILSTIFINCLPEEEYLNPHPKDAPLLLLQVSRGWRDLALSMSSLWSSISVRAGEDRCCPRKKLIETWLQRSGSRPLHFEIVENIAYDSTRELGVESFTTSADVLALFLPDFDRWKSVSLEYKDWRLGDIGFKNIPVDHGPLLLERLYLNRDYWQASVHPAVGGLFSGPRLRSVAWDGILNGYPNPAEIMPLHQLHELDLSIILPSQQFFSVLAQIPNIVTFRLSVSLGSKEDDWPELAKTPLTFSHLKSLRLLTNVMDERILDAIIAPSLEEFKVARPTVAWNGFTPERCWSHDHFKVFWQKSSKFSLKTLDFTDMDILPAELLELLQLFSSTLESLVLANDHVQDKCVDDAVLKALTPTPNSTMLCPHLEFIKFWDCTASMDGLAAELLEKRWEGGDDIAQLRMVLAYFGDEEKNSDNIRRLELAHQRKRGLTLLRPKKYETWTVSRAENVEENIVSTT
ncbi:hypothetical protein D9758_012192 [Tetrapyrgos nigripes]|uniref:F-box domain-containing protein n=1 Tax=Tetrapyrgos nigripes TaxID=182062 RepID=A0A8H5CFR8_9AGAR|nr:hypothetical protein D9758_012192 [Tetrapyrgos nigripes]